MRCDAAILEEFDTNMGEYYMGEIVQKCLSGPEGECAAVRFCRVIADAEKRYAVVMNLRGAVLPALFKAYPHGALEEFLPRVGSPSYLAEALVGHDEDDRRENPLGKIPPEVQLDWCRQNPESNFDRAAACVPFRADIKDESCVAWHPLAAVLVVNSPDPGRIIRRIAERFDPMGGWGGSIAAAVERNGQLLDCLPIPLTPGLETVVVAVRLKVQAAAKRWRDWAERDQQEGQDFE